MTEIDLKRLEDGLEKLEDLAREHDSFFGEEVMGFTAELLAIVRGEDSTFDDEE